jgi:SAM-dependent methyltransferase
MTELARLNPTERFSKLAELYARHRPDYPDAAIDWLIGECRLGPNDLVADIGCGTGISTRQLAARGLRVVGIDPNEPMRIQAVEAGGPAVEYRAGRGEATGLSDGEAALVVCAQAFHWFDAPAALAEFHRILRPGGHAALIWNERDESDAMTKAYGAAIRLAPEAAVIEGGRVAAGQPLLDSPLFTAGRRVEFRHGQSLDEEGLLGRAFSASYVPKEPPLADRIAAALRDVFARFQSDGRVNLRYVTAVYLARVVALPAGRRRWYRRLRCYPKEPSCAVRAATARTSTALPPAPPARPH